MTARHMSKMERRGQALVEFALVMPLLLLLLVGLIEFGRAWNLHQVVTDASREGARNAALPGVDADSVRKIVKRALANAAVNPANPAINIPVDDDNLTGNPASVTVSVPYEFVFLGPIMSWFTTGWSGANRSITITARSTMRNE